MCTSNGTSYPCPLGNRNFRHHTSATSVGGALTGKGGNLLIVDDPLKATDAHSETARSSARDWFQTTLSSRLDNPKHDAILNEPPKVSGLVCVPDRCSNLRVLLDGRLYLSVQQHSIGDHDD